MENLFNVTLYTYKRTKSSTQQLRLHFSNRLVLESVLKNSTSLFSMVLKLKRIVSKITKLYINIAFIITKQLWVRTLTKNIT